MRPLALPLGLLVVGLVFTTPSRAAPVSTFDSSTEGWTTVGASVFEWRNTDGNPPGFLYIDNSEGAITRLIAPAAFLGNLSVYDGGAIFFDGRMLGTGGSFYNQPGADYGSISISGGGASATLDLVPGGATPSTSIWTTYSAPLTAAAWGKTDMQWAQILASVSNITLSVEALFGNEIQGIDNIGISAVPAPAAVWLLGTGLAGLVAFRAHRRQR